MYTISKSARYLTLLFVLFLGVGALAFAAGQEAIGTANPVADIVFGSQRIDWQLKSAKAEITLIVAAPDGQIYRKVFGPSVVPTFALKPEFADGQYTYELRVSAPGTPRIRSKQDETPVYNPLESEMVQSGTFVVNQGSVVLPGLKEPVKPTTTGNAFRTGAEKTTVGTMDVVHADDVIITGSECVGFDCLTDGTENFGFDTIKMKENNLQIFFDDTSATAGFPANDWRIVANDSSSGGSNYLSIHDVTGAKVPFKIIAGARTNSIFVSSTGRVGLGTATPVLDLHLVRGDSPSMRLEQDSTSGWTAQTWDIAGNESNFFVRDTTGGSKLPFRIQPGTPTNTITMKSDGKVGIGTWSPDAPLDIESSGSYVFFRLTAAGASPNTAADLTFTDGPGSGSFRINIVDGDPQELQLDNNGNLTIAGTLTTATQTIPDYVFNSDYQLMPLSELAKYVAREKHLPNVPSNKDIQARGSLNLNEMQLALLEKVEELTLYTLAQENTINELKARLAALEQREK